MKHFHYQGCTHPMLERPSVRLYQKVGVTKSWLLVPKLPSPLQQMAEWKLSQYSSKQTVNCNTCLGWTGVTFLLQSVNSFRTVSHYHTAIPLPMFISSRRRMYRYILVSIVRSIPSRMRLNWHKKHRNHLGLELQRLYCHCNQVVMCWLLCRTLLWFPRVTSTLKNATFNWTEQCQEWFDYLRVAYMF